MFQELHGIGNVLSDLRSLETFQGSVFIAPNTRYVRNPSEVRACHKETKHAAAVPLHSAQSPHRDLLASYFLFPFHCVLLHTPARILFATFAIHRVTFSIYHFAPKRPAGAERVELIYNAWLLWRLRLRMSTPP
ncbi:MAG TPA: hypothetical protein VGD45_04755 [Steroidobacter sp.]